jgi:predicted nucleic acid-binding protein
MVGLIDSSIVIDILRGNASAVAWFQHMGQMGISRIVTLEVLQGAPSIQHQQNALQLLNALTDVELTVSDFIWSKDQLIQYRLTKGVGAFDCLIAAPSFRLKLPLYTLNLKHFTPILGALAQRPY